VTNIFFLIVRADIAYFPNFVIYKYVVQRRKKETRGTPCEDKRNYFRRTTVQISGTDKRVFAEPLWTDDASGRVATTFVHFTRRRADGGDDRGVTDS